MQTIDTTNLELDLRRLSETTELFLSQDELDKLSSCLLMAAQDLKTLRIALAESVSLQSHYADLLNQYDGGKRVGFPDIQSWVARLRELGRVETLLH